MQKFENDPNNQLNDLQISIDDRLVFILSTFFIRYFSVILIQWCIDINLIKTFDEGFMYYAAIYLAIFWLIVLFINIENRIFKEKPNKRNSNEVIPYCIPITL